MIASRPPHVLAWLARHGLGEIRVRKGGITLERAFFRMEDVGRAACACEDCEQMQVLSGRCRDCGGPALNGLCRDCEEMRR